jgi:hypothetical protein
MHRANHVRARRKLDNPFLCPFHSHEVAHAEPRLHYIVKVSVSGRILYGYRFGIVPES